LSLSMIFYTKDGLILLRTQVSCKLFPTMNVEICIIKVAEQWVILVFIKRWLVFIGPITDLYVKKYSLTLVQDVMHVLGVKHLLRQTELP
jgi:hypothetical protein